MPELPEVEAVCRRLRENLGEPHITAARILRPSVSRPQNPLSVQEGATGQSITKVGRKGKHILLDLSNGRTLHIHLRMTGNLYIIPDVRLHAAATRAIFELEGGRGIVFEDQRALGKIQLHKTGEIDALLKDVGPEAHEISEADFRALARQSKTPSKLFLMDQARVCGFGNIYAAEALFHAKIDPRRPLRGVSKPRLTGLLKTMVEMMDAAKESAYRAYAEPGYFAEAENFPLAVFGREGEPCHECARHIQRIAQGGRSTYFCPKCQK